MNDPSKCFNLNDHREATNVNEADEKRPTGTATGTATTTHGTHREFPSRPVETVELLAVTFAAWFKWLIPMRRAAQAVRRPMGGE